MMGGLRQSPSASLRAESHRAQFPRSMQLPLSIFTSLPRYIQILFVSRSERASQTHLVPIQDPKHSDGLFSTDHMTCRWSTPAFGPHHLRQSRAHLPFGLGSFSTTDIHSRRLFPSFTSCYRRWCGLCRSLDGDGNHWISLTRTSFGFLNTTRSTKKPSRITLLHAN